MSYEAIYKMEFAKIYPLLVNKAQRKNRTKKEVDEIITWLTGYSEEDISEMAKGSTTYREFFEHAPVLNLNRKLITGKVCGVKVEDIENPLDQEIRYLDKLIDELAKGKSMDKILRK